MQKSIIALFLITLAFGLNAQDAEPAQAEKPALTFEAALQTTAFFDRLLNNEETNLRQNPYLLTGKLAWGRLALRTGVGGARSQVKESEEGFADSKTTLDQHLDLRLGFERRYPLGGKWTCMVGLDVVGYWSQIKSVEDSGFDVITVSEDTQEFGAGPVIGLQFDISSRFSLYTEGFLYYTRGEVTEGRFFKNFPIFDDQKDRTETDNAKISVPSSLFLVFKF